MQPDIALQYYETLEASGKLRIPQGEIDRVLKSVKPDAVFVVANDLGTAGILDMDTQKIVCSVPVELVGCLVKNGKAFYMKGGTHVTKYGVKPAPVQKKSGDKPYVTGYAQKRKMIDALRRRKFLHADEMDALNDIFIAWEVFRTENPESSVQKFLSQTETGQLVQKLQSGFREIMVALVLNDSVHSLEEFEKAMKWPMRSSKLVLKMAVQAFNEIRN